MVLLSSKSDLIGGKDNNEKEELATYVHITCPENRSSKNSVSIGICIMS